MKKNLDFENELWNEYSLIAGVDEAGRGALAGPIIIGIVALPKGFKNINIQDSKTLSKKQRERALEIIKKKAIFWHTHIVSVNDIEKNNPLQATKIGMKQIILKLKTSPDLVLIDGKETVFLEKIKTISICQGDSKSINIAAASIVAKVTRDQIMKNLDRFFPAYGWVSNKGYGEKKHLSEILKNKFSPYHRKNYEPVKSLLKPNCDIEKLKKKYKLTDKT